MNVAVCVIGCPGMGYRDDQEALRSRVDQLEGDLADARDKIAALTGERAVGPEPAPSRLTGAPRGVALERVLDYEIDDEGLERIAQLVRRHLGVTVAQVG